MNKMFLLAGVFAVSYYPGDCQDSSTLSLNVYGDVYYVYDFAKPELHTRPPFVYSYNRTGEVNINLAYIKASFVNRTVRSNLAVIAGTYSNANLASEPGVLKNIFEANAGVRLSKHREFWIDAGVLPSHIGFETATGKDN